ncbi:MAG: lysozyme inhibitor LprI family protein [Chthoniobacteraceae bacterium]
MKIMVLFAVLTLGVTIVKADDKPSLAQARKQFDAADKVLNTAYKGTCAELDKVKIGELRQKQRDWLEYRDFMAEAFPQFNGVQTDTPKQTPDYWQMMTDLSKERTEFLHAYSGENVPSGISGEYSDSHQGDLELEETKAGIVLSLFVVRGAHAHTGDVSGNAHLKGDQAFFKDHPDPVENRVPCELTFTFIDGHIVKIEGKNTDYYHGMGVSFDGMYYKTGKLKKSIKLE